MAPSSLRKAIGAVKDKTSIGLAKVGSSTSLSDLDVAIVKATRHEEQPAEEKYIREILSLTCYSRAYVNACVNTMSRRLNKTKNWTVALKTLMLIHRVLSEGDPAYEQEVFFATRRGTRMLNMSDFRDTSHSDSWDFSAFVRTYALYLDERLEFRMHGRRNRRRASLRGGDDDEDEAAANAAAAAHATPVRELNISKIFTRTQHLQQLLDRFLACRPTGAARSSRVVTVALYPLVKESFQIYYDITEIMGIMIDRFMELEIVDCVKIYDIFTRISKQFEELDAFYSWCKTIGVARSSEYPEVEKITSKKLEVMDDFICEKSALEERRKGKGEEPDEENDDKETIAEAPTEDELMNIKALPPPEGFDEDEAEEEEKKTEELAKEEEKDNRTVEEADFLNLSEDTVSREEHGDKLALALFDGELKSPPKWEAFNDEPAADWETALVQSASNLATQKLELGGGFNKLLLDGMYQQAAAAAAASSAGGMAYGSASSVALLGGAPKLMALPAPPVAGGIVENQDPFTASLMVAPPSYVQMSDMEKKQRLLVEEQLIWQQYSRDGMQGQLSLAKIQSSPYAKTFQS